MTGSLALPFARALAGAFGILPWLRRVVAGPSGPAQPRGLADALGAAGAWYFEVDAERRIREVFPAPAAVRAALLGHDIRSFIDPLDPLNEHPRLARAFRGRAPFRDVVMPFNRGAGARRLRVSGDPIYDARGTFLGYRGLAIDATDTPAPTGAANLIAPDLRDGLVNSLGVAIGFARFLEQDLPEHSSQASYAARVVAATGAARALLMPSSPTAPDAAPRPAPRARCGRVLIIQPIPAIGDLLAIAFERAGFESAVCRDGLEAVDILAEHPTPWDVLVTPAETPTIPGATVLRRAKALRPTLLGVVCDAPDAAATAQQEADLCWPRPADVVALAEHVKAELVLRCAAG